MARIDPLVQRLIDARIQAGLSQRTVARKTGIAQNNTSAWESGRNTPQVESLRRWAAGLDLELTFVDAAGSSTENGEPRG